MSTAGEAAKRDGSAPDAAPTGTGAGAGGDDSERKRRRKSRWGDEDSKVFLPGMPTALPPNLTPAEQELFIIQLRLEEVNRKLRTGEVVPPEHERSPSPPIYDRDGSRLNSREKRYRLKLEDERQKLVDEVTRRDPSYRPPMDYRKPTKYKEKVYIPVREFPEINFIGQLIGPRGNTLKRLEREAGGVKIFIRGKGSVKEGKNTAMHPDDEDDLHCLVQSESEEKVKKAVESILEVIEIAKSVPEEFNERKKQQLMELAALNGTLRNDDKMICRNCGEMGHKERDCPQERNITNSMRCSLCGNGGHLRRDCFLNVGSNGQRPSNVQPSAMDQEYQSLMKELSGGGGGASSGSPFPTYVPPGSGGSGASDAARADPSAAAATGWPPAQTAGWPPAAAGAQWAQGAAQWPQGAAGADYAAWYAAAGYYGGAQGGMYAYPGYYGAAPAAGAAPGTAGSQPPPPPPPPPPPSSAPPPSSST